MATIRGRCLKETELALLKQELAQQRSLLTEVHSAVVGEKDQPGLKGRVDRIETTQTNIVKGVTIFGTLMSIALAITAFFRGGK